MSGYTLRQLNKKVLLLLEKVGTLEKEIEELKKTKNKKGNK